MKVMNSFQADRELQKNYYGKDLVTKPAFLTKNAIAKAKKPTASRFEPGVSSCCQRTVCGLSSSQHQNQLNFE